MSKSLPKLSRDVVILVGALAMGAWEMLHEARPVVLTFLGSLIAGPLVMRADEHKKEVAKADADEAEASE